MPTRSKKSSPSRNREPPHDEEYFADLVYKHAGRTRYTQDSPILADVFVHYALKSDDDVQLDFGRQNDDDFRLDLLITPHQSRTAQQLATELRDRLEREKIASLEKNGEPEDAPPGEAAPFYIAANQSVVAIRLTFEELLRYVLPLSSWWKTRLIAVEGLKVEKAYRDPVLRQLIYEQVVAGLRHERAKLGAPTRGQRWLIRQDFIWAARLFYLVQHSNRKGKRDGSEKDVEAMARYFVNDIVGSVASQDPDQEEKQLSEDLWTYTVNRNRPIKATVFDSMRTIKADAASRTFDVTGKGIRWAIVDSGIDATHPAFRRHDNEGQRFAAAFIEDSDSPTGWKTNTRIKKTYDFSKIRQNLPVKQLRALLDGRLLNWRDVIDQLGLEIPFKVERPVKKDRPYRTPGQAHGTHVAGILGANWHPDETDADPLGPRQTTRKPPQPLLGVCPDIELYDLRVFDDDGKGDEFSVISALQFVRWVNQQHESMEIHGVNLSLAMLHEVNNYACGRSPVCDECTRLVGNGVVVVAAAGNDGRSVHTTTQGRREDGYRAISISDPGNAEAVITVGSTHRREPHTYGVSYFSSRGPTGDGRLKPDLVAPGEKITSTVPGSAMAQQDGTSQAAPHVSGAAALLMSRHTEFVGQPTIIKKILMDNAIDLGREKQFQGAGLVDIFGAMQRV